MPREPSWDLSSDRTWSHMRIKSMRRYPFLKKNANRTSSHRSDSHKMANRVEPSDHWEWEAIFVRQFRLSNEKCLNLTKVGSILTNLAQMTNFRIDEQRSLFKWHLCKINTICNIDCEINGQYSRCWPRTENFSYRNLNSDFAKTTFRTSQFSSIQ